ncbi:MAG: hypothetical protein ACXIT9_01260 [Nitritalea sp.]
MQKRKGARSIGQIPAEILAQLNRGQISSANLVEWLAVDQQVLLEHVLAQFGRTAYLPSVGEKLGGKQTANALQKQIGKLLYQLAAAAGDKEFGKLLSHHPSDTVRCWAAYFIAERQPSTLDDTLKALRPLAADEHFGVREVAWMAFRPLLLPRIPEAVEKLVPWVQDADENIRRFASEATRPRGVWCAHSPVLKAEPALGLLLLEPLHADPSRYVQLSVGNWLNDAAKTQPHFVRTLCAAWLEKSPVPATRFICQKALRSVGPG